MLVPSTLNKTKSAASASIYTYSIDCLNSLVRKNYTVNLIQITQYCQSNIYSSIIAVVLIQCNFPKHKKKNNTDLSHMKSANQLLSTVNQN